MSFLDKIAAALMPAETDEDRLRARHAAISMAGDNDWLANVILHHRHIERLLANARAATTAMDREDALKLLARHLTAHSMAEEVVLYPALAHHGEKAAAGEAYQEEAMTKIQMAALANLDPMAPDWLEKLDAIREAVLHHVYEEEATWYPRLREQAAEADQQVLTHRFLEEYHRHHDLDMAGFAGRADLGRLPPAMGAADF
ncbi:MAG: hemerythrin domain-containing protein [Novosphingobium sp.]